MSPEPKRIKLENVSKTNKVEDFQKKAIYMEMLEYKRKYENSITTLETYKQNSTQEIIHLTAFRSKIFSLFHLNEHDSLERLDERLLEKVEHKQDFEKLHQLEARVELLSKENVRLMEDLEQKDLELGSTLKKVMRLKEQVSQVEKESVPVAAIPAPHHDPDQELMILNKTRLNEIHKLMDEKKWMQQEIDRLTMEQIHHRPPTNEHIEKELRYQLSLQDELKEQLLIKAKELELMQQSRRQFQDQLLQDEEKRRKILEAEVKKLEGDVSRLRQGRDTLQRNLDLIVAKEAQDSQVLEQVKIVSESRKEKIKSLESEMTRLKMKYASDHQQFDLSLFLDTAKGDSLDLLTSAAKKALADFESRMNMDITDQILLVEKQNLEKELTSYKRMFGELGSVNDHAKLVAERESELSKLKTKLDIQQKAETRLFQELETLGMAWQQLEEQVSSKLLNLVEKEEQIQKLIQEKTKLEQKISLMSKQQSSYNNTMTALKRQHEKQLEQIRKYEELEKNLQQQLNSMEQQVASVTPEMEVLKRKTEQLTIQIAELMDQIHSLKVKNEQYITLLHQKSGEIEGLVEGHRKATEQASVLKKRVEQLSKGENGEADQYRLLLMCQSCNDKIKSHVLLKCMHTFCKECIDDMYNSRQRKCPTCGVPFGQQDIKPVYL